MAGGGPLAMNLLVVSQDDVLQKCRNHRIEGLATHHPSQHFIAWETGRLDGRASEQPPGWGCSNHQSEVSVVPVQPLGCRPTFENLSPESSPLPNPPKRDFTDQLQADHSFGKALTQRAGETMACHRADN
eukprot:EG_transcript_20848